jgi:hypothetical protein
MWTDGRKESSMRGVTPGGLVKLEGTEFEDAFAQRRPVSFGHSIADHPLLSIEAVADLADRLAKHSVVREEAVKPLVAPDYRSRRGEEPRPGDLIRDLENSASWLTLLNVEQDPSYADLVNEYLDEVEPYVDARPGHMRRRAGFIFVSSPNSITPAHFDVEHSLIMQVRGNRTLSFGSFSGGRVRKHEIRRYWNGSHGKIESLPEESMAFDLGPGVGGYIPPITPHWIRNGPAPSLSVTMTFFTPDTEQDMLIQAFNARLRKFRMSPRDPGESRVVDLAKVVAMRTYDLRHRLRPGHRKADGGY